MLAERGDDRGDYSDIQNDADCESRVNFHWPTTNSTTPSIPKPPIQQQTRRLHALKLSGRSREIGAPRPKAAMATVTVAKMARVYSANITPARFPRRGAGSDEIGARAQDADYEEGDDCCGDPDFNDKGPVAPVTSPLRGV